MCVIPFEITIKLNNALLLLCSWNYYSCSQKQLLWYHLIPVEGHVPVSANPALFNYILLLCGLNEPNSIAGMHEYLFCKSTSIEQQLIIPDPSFPPLQQPVNHPLFSTVATNLLKYIRLIRWFSITLVVCNSHLTSLSSSLLYVCSQQIHIESNSHSFDYCDENIYYVVLSHSNVSHEIRNVLTYNVSPITTWALNPL